MNDNKDEIIKTIATGAMLSIMAGLVKALIVKQEPILVRLRNFFAGVILGTLVAYLLRSVRLDEFYKEIIICGFSAFISSIWPVLEKIFLNWTKKGERINDVLRNNDN